MRNFRSPSVNGQMHHLFILLLVLWVSTATAAPQIILRGKILLPDGTPGAGTAIRADLFEMSPTTGWQEKATGPATTAAADGTYELHIHQNRRSHVTIEREGYASSFLTFFRSRPREATKEHVLDITLQPEAVVRGIVLGPAGEPLPNTTVGGIARRTKVHTGGFGLIPALVNSKTKPDGTFELRGLPPEEIEIFVRHDDYMPTNRYVRAPADSVQFQLAPGGASISGRVLRYGTREPVTSVSVLLNSAVWDPEQPYQDERMLTTATDGSFRTDHLLPGKYKLLAQAPLSGLTHAGSNPEIKLADGETTTGIEIIMHPGHILSGRVSDAITRLPLEGVVLSSARNDIWTSTTTDSSGSYKMGPVGASWRNSLNISAEKPGYLYASSSQHLGGTMVSLPGFPLDQLDAEHNFELHPSLPVHGTIRDDNGDPVPNAQVMLVAGHASSFPAWTDQTGRYILQGLPGREVSLTARITDTLTVTSEKFLIGPGTSPVDLILVPTASISGMVTDENGTPVTGANISGFDAWATSIDGGFRLAGLKPRTDFVTVRAQGFLIATAGPFALVSRQSLENLQITLRRGKPLAGRVVDPDGNPLQGVAVFCPTDRLTPGVESAIAFTDGTGQFRIDACETTDGIELDYKGSKLRFPAIVPGREDLELVFSAWSDVVLDFVDYDTSAPLDYVEVDLEGRKVRAEDGSGVLRLRIPTPTHNQVHATATAPGYVPTQQFINADPATGIYRYTFRIGRGAMLRGEVVRAVDNMPLGEVVVKVQGGGWVHTDLSVKADPSGRFETGPLAPGSYEVIAMAEKPLVPKMERVELTHGSEKFVSLRVDSGMTIQGRLLHEDGRPLAGEEIDILPIGYGAKQKAEQMVRTSSDGSFTATGLQEGWRHVRVAGYQHFASGNFSREVNRVDFRVGSGSLQLTVGGAPGNGFEATLKKQLDLTSLSHDEIRAKLIAPPPVQVYSIASGTTGIPLTFNHLAEGSYTLEIQKTSGPAPITIAYITIARRQTLVHQVTLEEL